MQRSLTLSRYKKILPLCSLVAGIWSTADLYISMIQHKIKNSNKLDKHNASVPGPTGLDASLYIMGHHYTILCFWMLQVHKIPTLLVHQFSFMRSVIIQLAFRFTDLDYCFSLFPTIIHEFDDQPVHSDLNHYLVTTDLRPQDLESDSFHLPNATGLHSSLWFEPAIQRWRAPNDPVHTYPVLPLITIINNSTHPLIEKPPGWLDLYHGESNPDFISVTFLS